VRKEEDVQRAVETGITDLSRYGGGGDPILDIFVDKS
jgi:citronellol/citronellal dehydrogenase